MTTGLLSALTICQKRLGLSIGDDFGGGGDSRLGVCALLLDGPRGLVVENEEPKPVPDGDPKLIPGSFAR